MEKKKIIWTLLTGLAISLVIAAGSMTYAAQQERSIVQKPEPTVPATEPSTEPGYLLRIHEGQLSLFRIGSDEPYEKLDMPLNLLSEYDYDRLEQGVTARTEAEMRRLIEDYTS